MSDIKPNLQIELEDNQFQKEEPVENLIVKTYHYKSKSGKDRIVVRKYTVKNDKSYKNIPNKEIMNKYVEEHKDKYINTPKAHQASTLIKDIKNDLDLNLSYNGARSLLQKHCDRDYKYGPK